MEYLHSKGIVHFDMKSANLLLGHRDRRIVCKVPTVADLTHSRGSLVIAPSCPLLDWQRGCSAAP